MTSMGAWSARLTVIVATMALLLASMGPATAQQAGSARAEAYGAEISGLVDLGPLPDPVSAEVPPGESDSDSFVEVPAEPLVFSGTLSGNVEASQQADLSAKLQDIMDGASSASLPQAWNSRGHAITEDLGVLFQAGGGDEPVGGLEQPDDGEDPGGGQDPIGGEDPGGGQDPIGGEDPVGGGQDPVGGGEDPVGGGEDPVGGGEDPVDGGENPVDGEQTPDQQSAETSQQEDDPLLTAEVVESEAVAGCDGGDPAFATGSRIERLTLDGERIDALDPVTELVVQGEPNEDVLANTPGGDVLKELGLEIIAWETNWDGADGTTDNSETVWANALRVSVTEDSPLADVIEAQDVVVSHSEASVSNCDEDLGPAEAEGPLQDVSKESSEDTVAPGDTFTYTITVPNSDSTCTLENVDVVDTITGPAGSEITSTNPQADDINDLTVTWNDVGPIGPGEQVTLTVDVQVPTDAEDGEVYREEVDVTADCDGQPVEGGIDFDGPEVVDAQVGPQEQAADREPLPETGGGAAVTGLLLLGGGAFAAGLRRRLT